MVGCGRASPERWDGPGTATAPTGHPGAATVINPGLPANAAAAARRGVAFASFFGIAFLNVRGVAGCRARGPCCPGAEDLAVVRSRLLAGVRSCAFVGWFGRYTFALAVPPSSTGAVRRANSRSSSIERRGPRAEERIGTLRNARERRRVRGCGDGVYRWFSVLGWLVGSGAFSAMDAFVTRAKRRLFRARSREAVGRASVRWVWGSADTTFSGPVRVALVCGV